MTNEEALKIATSSNGLLYRANPNLKSEYIICIIDALEKRIHKKPKNEIGGLGEFDYKVCPDCSTQGIYDCEGNELEFCSCCGQAIDWSEENDE